MIEDYDWESDESEDWESDEAVGDSEDSAEDIGEARRRRRPIGYRPSPMRPKVRGVQGVAVSGPGGVRNLRFPEKVATAAETNAGLANEGLARRELAGRLNRLEARSRALRTKDSSVSGLVTLAIGGGLAGFGAIQAAGKSGSGTDLQKWVAEQSTRTAAVVSATQLATSGAKLVIEGRYRQSPIGITADIVAAAQLAAFAFGSLHKPRDFKIVANKDAAVAAMAIDEGGTMYLTLDTSEEFQLEIDAAQNRALRLVR